MKEKKALFITTSDMYDEYGNGGIKDSQKKYQLVEEFFGCDNTCLCTFPRKTDTIPPKNSVTFKRTQSKFWGLVAALCGCKVYLPWTEKEVVHFIKEYEPDLLFIDVSTLGRLACHKDLTCKTIVFYQNIEADYAWNKVKNEGIQFMPSYWASKYNDKCGIYADKVVCLSEKDSKRLYSLYGREADFLIPITFEDRFNKDRTIDNYPRSILFLGSLFPPNQYSIEWFIENVMPKLNNITLDIVGKGFEKKRALYEQIKGVRVIGSVQSLDEYYYRHAVVVLPIMYGAGMKVKTAEAMMFGRRIFASDEALEGYDITGVNGITRCNTAGEYADAINDYFEQGYFPRYYEEVRERFLLKYETRCLREGFKSFIKEMLYDS